MSESESTPIEDLELSVRSTEFVASLGVRTVEDLLALPFLAIPATTPIKVAKMMVAEIEELLAERGASYAGEWRLPPAKTTKPAAATGPVTARWRTIEAWLEENHPRVLDQFNPPAPPEAVVAAERAMNVTLPEDYKAFLALHNGQSEFAAMVGMGALLPVEELAETHANLFGEDDMEVDPALVGAGVRAVDLSKGWVPITKSARGRDFLCLDLDPAPGGVRGQIIEYIADDSARPLVAKSFADLLSLYFDQAQTGELDLEENLDEED